MMIVPPRIFISYCHRDRAEADQLVRQLNTSGVRAFKDTKHVTTDDDMPDRVKKGLDSAKKVILVWSKNAAASRWVAFEIGYATAREAMITPYVLDTQVPLPEFLKIKLKFQKGEAKKLAGILARDLKNERPRTAKRASSEVVAATKTIRNRFADAAKKESALSFLIEEEEIDALLGLLRGPSDVRGFGARALAALRYTDAIRFLVADFHRIDGIEHVLPDFGDSDALPLLLSISRFDARFKKEEYLETWTAAVSNLITADSLPLIAETLKKTGQRWEGLFHAVLRCPNPLRKGDFLPILSGHLAWHHKWDLRREIATEMAVSPLRRSRWFRAALKRIVRELSETAEYKHGFGGLLGRCLDENALTPDEVEEFCPSVDRWDQDELRKKLIAKRRTARRHASRPAS